MEVEQGAWIFMAGVPVGGWLGITHEYRRAGAALPWLPLAAIGCHWLPYGESEELCFSHRAGWLLAIVLPAPYPPSRCFDFKRNPISPALGAMENIHQGGKSQRAWQRGRTGLRRFRRRVWNATPLSAAFSDLFLPPFVVSALASSDTELDRKRRNHLAATLLEIMS